MGTTTAERIKRSKITGYGVALRLSRSCSVENLCAKHLQQPDAASRTSSPDGIVFHAQKGLLFTVTKKSTNPTRVNPDGSTRSKEKLKVANL